MMKSENLYRWNL